MKTALTIAGSDPTGGAGLQADLRTFNKFGVYGLSLPSVLTAQNTMGVSGIYEISADTFKAQIDSLLNDIRPDAMKTGMIYSPDIVHIIAGKIKEFSLSNLVVDPVTVSSTGVLLIKEGTVEMMKKLLFPLAKVVTPNVYEASVITGISIHKQADMKNAAIMLKGYGAEAVIITGGDITGKAIDTFYDGIDFYSVEQEKYEGEFHGTGCVFSSAIAALLAQGHDVKESFLGAKEFISSSIRSAFVLGKGMKILKF